MRSSRQSGAADFTLKDGLRWIGGFMRLIGIGLLWSIITTAVVQDGAKGKVFKPLLEEQNYFTLPTSSDVVDWLESWSEHSAHAQYVEIGRSVGGRPIGALFVSAAQDFIGSAKAGDGDSPGDSDRLRVLLVGGQHGNETASPEALQRVIYELLAGELQGLPEKMDIILVPIANPDGRDLGIRENAASVNTNTDYILLSQPEGRVLRQVIDKWQPHSVLDVHESEAFKKETLAQQGYVTEFSIQYEIGYEPNIDKRLRQFGTEEFLPLLLQRAASHRLQARRYIKEIFDINRPVTHGGITLRNFRNYAGFHNIFSVLVEGRIDPPEGTYPTPANIRSRTHDLYFGIASYLQEVLAKSDRIKTLTAAARKDWHGLAADNKIVLKSEYTKDPTQPTITIPLKEIGSNKQIHLDFSYHGEVVTLETMPLPAAYLVTAYQDRITELLDHHGIEYQHVDEQFSVKGVARYLDDIRIIKPPLGKGRNEIELETRNRAEMVTARPGDVWINLSQNEARLAPLLLEPQSTTSIFGEPEHTAMLNEGKFFIVSLMNLPEKSR